MGQYSKVAYLDYSSSPINLFEQTNIKLNLGFTPKKLIIVAVNGNITNDYIRQFATVSPNPFNSGDFNNIEYVENGNSEYREFSIKNFSGTELNFEYEYSNGVSYLGITHIIAIG